MHYHAEIWVPRKEGHEEMVKDLLAPFCEGNEDAKHSFWDWYVIGGRYSGTHTSWKLDKEKLLAFQSEFKEKYGYFTGGLERVTGAQRLEQSKEVFAKYFPDYQGVHPEWRDNYNGIYEDDVTPAEDMNWERFSAYTIIIPKERNDGAIYKDPSWDAEVYLTEIWNGTTWQKTKEDFVEIIKKNQLHEKGFWVTVDYHD